MPPRSTTTGTSANQLDSFIELSQAIGEAIEQVPAAGMVPLGLWVDEDGQLSPVDPGGAGYALAIVGLPQHALHALGAMARPKRPRATGTRASGTTRGRRTTKKTGTRGARTRKPAMA